MSSPDTTTRSAKRIGTGFWVMFWALALVVGAWQFGSWENQQQMPNSDPYTEVDADHAMIQLKANRNGHYLVGGSLNNQRVHFLIDTGATQVALPLAVAERAGLRSLGSAIANTANGTVRVQRTRIDRLTIGPITVENVEATIMPDMNGPVLLGMSVLRGLELTHRDNLLTLTQKLRP